MVKRESVGFRKLMRTRRTPTPPAAVLGFDILKLLAKYIQASFFLKTKSCGALRETRTPDLLITNQMLFQLSYEGLKTLSY